MRALRINVLLKLLVLVILPLFLFLFSPFRNTAFAALCNETACEQKGGPTYACTGTGNNCEQQTYACRPTPITAASTCGKGDHAHNQPQNLCCPGGGTCNNGSCTTPTNPPDCGSVATNTVGYVCGTDTTKCSPVSTNATANQYCVKQNPSSFCCQPITIPGPNPGPNPNPVPPTTGCPKCAAGWTYEPPPANKCTALNNTPTDPTPDPCSGDKDFCYPGCGCNTPCGANVDFNPGNAPCPGGVCHTAIGDIQTNFGSLVNTIFLTILSLAMIVAIFLIFLSAYRLLFSQGNPEQVQKAREQLTAAIVGLLFIIFAFVILEFIGLDLLGLPGLNHAGGGT